MQEAEAKLVLDSLSSVMPYLVYPQELRAIVEKAMNESADVKNFIEKFKQTISAEADPTHKTDGQILVNELRRKLSNAVSI